jgi:hypothetical protein
MKPPTFSSGPKLVQRFAMIDAVDSIEQLGNFSNPSRPDQDYLSAQMA